MTPRLRLLFSMAESPEDVNAGRGWTLNAARSWADANGFADCELQESVVSGGRNILLWQSGVPGLRSAELEPDRRPKGIQEWVSGEGGERGIESRTVELDEVRVTPASGDAPPVLAGHAAVFEKLSADLGRFREKVARGAFSESIGKDDVVALWNHNPEHLLGRNKSKTLRLKEDGKGLAFEVDLPDTQVARDLAVLVNRGDVRGASFRFRTIKDAWEFGKQIDTRTLVQVQLVDVSPVTFPAYPQTDVGIRSLLEGAGVRDEAKLRWLMEIDNPAAARTLNRKRDLDLLEIDG